MADSRLFTQDTEALQSSVVASELVNESLEAGLSSVVRSSLVNQEVAALLRSSVSVSAQNQHLEAVLKPTSVSILLQSYAEVVWKEPPTPEILPWRHNWDAEIRESLQWKTEVLTSRDGSERRSMLRNRPRRSLTYKFTLSGKSDSLGFVSWINDNMGDEVLIPLLHHRVIISAPFAEEVDFVFDGFKDVTDLYAANLQPFENSPIKFQNRDFTVLSEGEILFVAPSGEYQRNTGFVEVVGPNRGLTLSEPLARAIPQGTFIYPLVKGLFRQSPNIQHLASDVIEATLDLELRPPHYSYLSDGSWASAETVQEENPITSLPAIFGWTKWNDWGDAIDLGFQPKIESFDNELATPFTLRVNDNGNYSIKRRFYAVGEDEIFKLKGFLDYLSGRLSPIFLDEQIQGIKIASNYSGGDPVIIIENNLLGTWLNKPGYICIQPNDGVEPNRTCKMSSIHSIDSSTAALTLAKELPIDLTSKSVITRLLVARLQHDLVELIYKTDSVVEVNLTFQVLNDPIIDQSIENDYWVPIEACG